MDPRHIYEGLLERGLPEHVALGFMDNFAAESGLNPGINEVNPTVPGSRGGRGLYQLTGPRRKDYEAQYGDSYNVDSQLDFMMSELGGTESRAAEAIYNTSDRGEATQAISRKFLRPGEDNSAARVGMWGDNYTAPPAGPSLSDDGSIRRPTRAGVSRSAGLEANARQNSGPSDGPGYKQSKVANKLQGKLADKIGGKRMAGIGSGLMGLSEKIMEGELF